VTKTAARFNDDKTRVLLSTF